MSAKVPANNEDVSVSPKDQKQVSDDSMKTTPYGNKETSPEHTNYPTVLKKDAPLDARREPYRVAAIVATGIALLTSMGSVITAGVMWQQAYEYTGTDTDRVLYAALYIFVLVESCLSFVATLVYFSELFFRPRNVLIHDGDSAKFVGRCIAVFLLFLLAIYSFVVPIVLRNHEPKTSAALCVIPGVRFVALISFFGILIADSRV